MGAEFGRSSWFDLYVEQQSTAGGGAGVCSVEVVLHFQFKKPLWTAGAQENTVHTINLDTLEILPPEPPTESQK